MKSAALPILSILVLSPALLAQTKTVVIPQGLTKVEGNAFEMRPFSYNRVRVAQHIGASMLKGAIAKGNTITALAWRRDGTTFPGLTMVRPPRTGTSDPTWTIRMGNTTGNTSNPLPFHARPPSGRGRGPIVRTAFTAKKVKFPNLTHTKGVLPGFVLKFPLDVPFVHNGTSLVIDHQVYESRNQTFAYFVDAHRGKVDQGSSKSYGSSCPVDVNRAYALSTNPGGGAIELYEFDGPPKSAALCVIGISKTSFGAVQLPWDLSFLGLKGCSLLSSMEIAYPVPTNDSGRADLKLPLPPTAQHANVTFWNQWINLDKRVNPAFPLTLSNGVEVRSGSTIGNTGGINGALVYGIGQNQVVNGLYGFVDPGIVLVTQFTIK